MMLRGADIEKAVKDGTLGISPFDPAKLKSASYTFTLSNRLKIFDQNQLLTPAEPHDSQEITFEEYILKPGAFVVGYIAEQVSLNNNFSCMLGGRSYCGQIGLDVLQTDYFCEPDTAEMSFALGISNSNTVPIKLEPGLGVVKGIFFSL